MESDLLHHREERQLLLGSLEGRERRQLLTCPTVSDMAAARPVVAVLMTSLSRQGSLALPCPAWPYRTPREYRSAIHEADRTPDLNLDSQPAGPWRCGPAHFITNSVEPSSCTSDIALEGRPSPQRQPEDGFGGGGGKKGGRRTMGRNNAAYHYPADQCRPALRRVRTFHCLARCCPQHPKTPPATDIDSTLPHQPPAAPARDCGG